MCPSGRRSPIANRVLGETLTEGSNPSISTRYTIQILYAPLAQLDRASGYGPEGQEFESLRVYLEASVERLRLFLFFAQNQHRKINPSNHCCHEQTVQTIIPIRQV